MSNIDYSFEKEPWEQELDLLHPGEHISAAAVLTVLEQEDELTVDYPMELRTQRPESWEEETVYIPNRTVVRHDERNDDYIALFRGPLTLAADSRTGKPADSVFDFEPVGELCADVLRPVQEEYARLIADKKYLEEVMKLGAERASYAARRTLSKVKRKMGFTDIPR